MMIQRMLPTLLAIGLLVTSSCQYIGDSETNGTRSHGSVESEAIVNEFQITGLQKPGIPPKVTRTDALLELSDLALRFRRVRFDQRIDGRPSLYFGEYEITNSMYASYLAASGLKRDDSVLVRVADDMTRPRSTCAPVVSLDDMGAVWQDGKFPISRGDHPVVLITMPQAMNFCRWLNARYRLNGEFRLPTEAEWLAAAFGKHRKYPWGNLRADWISELTYPVNSRPHLMTPDGLHGMWGNGAELVLSESDGYGSKVKNPYQPIITKWQGPGFQPRKVRGKLPAPRQDYWGYTHSNESRSDQRGFRVVFVPDSRNKN